jgi:hypothetical protein
MNISHIVVHSWTIVAWFSKGSVPLSCLLPCAQNCAVNFLMNPSGYHLHLKSQVLDNMMCFSNGVILVNHRPNINVFQSCNFHFHCIPIFISKLSSCVLTRTGIMSFACGYVALSNNGWMHVTINSSTVQSYQ